VNCEEDDVGTKAGPGEDEEVANVGCDKLFWHMAVADPATEFDPSG